jgi:hypothetical protein
MTLADTYLFTLLPLDERDVFFIIKINTRTYSHRAKLPVVKFHERLTKERRSVFTVNLKKKIFV